jgi:hypothetical protein
MNNLIFLVFVAVMWLRITLFTVTSSCNPREVSCCIYSALNSHICCELLYCVDIVCCAPSQTSINCQQLVYQVHVTAFLSTCIQIDSLLNCRCIYCIKIYVLKSWGIGSLQFLPTFLHVCDISSLCKETGKWILCCTRCASCFCTGVCLCVHAHVQANWPSSWRKMSMLYRFRYLWNVVDSLAVVKALYLYTCW